MVDWLSFGGVVEGATTTGPCLAAFSPVERDTILFTGHASRPEVAVYDLVGRAVVHSIGLNAIPRSLAVTPAGMLVVGASLTVELSWVVDVTWVVVAWVVDVGC